jgi:hypothetical protein
MAASYPLRMQRQRLSLDSTRKLSSKSRSVISITVEVYDELGAHTLSAKFEWFIQREKRI